MEIEDKIEHKIEILKGISNILDGKLSKINVTSFDVMSLIPIINLLGLECGIELGTSSGFSSFALLHYCPTIKKLYTIDKYEPYVDIVGDPPFVEVTLEDSSFYKKCAEKLLKSPNVNAKDRAEIIYGDTLEIAKDFENEKYDFIFMDSHLSPQQLKSELPLWYPKIRKGGIISIHDTNVKEVCDVIIEFGKENNITSHIGYFHDTALWIK